MIQSLPNSLLAEGWMTPATGVAVLILLAAVSLGLKDLVRFSLTRTLAIASVCFTQARRRGVLYIAPLVILGVMATSQFQKAEDSQDAIRQTTNVCLFAAGLLVTVVIIMVACTNLPREIENRVIHTITTKPVTRLEIVLGKAMGFSAVSFCILLIMGVFSLVYLNWLDQRERSLIRAQLESNEIPMTSRATAEYYSRFGTLHARVFGAPRRLSFLAAEPKDENDWWIPSDPRLGGDGTIVVPFQVDATKVLFPPDEPEPETFGPPRPVTPTAGGLWIVADVQARRSTATTMPATGPSPTSAPASKPRIGVDLRDAAGQIVVPWTALLSTAMEKGELESERGGLLRVYVSPQHFRRWLVNREGINDVCIGLTGQDTEHEYAVNQRRIRLTVADKSSVFEPSGPSAYVGPVGSFGQRLRGHRDGIRRIALYEFRQTEMSLGKQTQPFELRVFTEMDRDEYNAEDQTPELRLTFRNRKTGAASPEMTVFPENNRPLYFDVPGADVEGGDFDVTLRCTSPHFVSLRGGMAASLRVVAADQSFSLNLLKSLTILWLMSVLVVIVSVLCSTFLSWPIAIVLTLLILSGRWCVEELGDLAKPGVGNQVVNDLFRGSSAEVSRAVSKSVDELARLTNIVAPLLPELSRFSAMEEMNRGTAVSNATLLGAGRVTLFHGVVMLALAWLFLRYKEVAP